MNDESENEKRPGFLGRLKAGLSLTRSRLTSSIEDLVLGEKAVDDALLEDIEAALLSADVGVSTTAEIVDNMTKRLERAELSDSQAVYQGLRDELFAKVELDSLP